MISYVQHLFLEISEPTLRRFPPSEPLPNRENYAHYDDNPLKRASEHPISTFSIDVDTGILATTIHSQTILIRPLR
jgi:hypothetical protein